MALVVKKRCPRCRQVVGKNGHCQNPECLLYHPAPVETTDTTDTTKESVENSEGKK